MRVFLQVSAHDFNEFRICLPLRPDRTSRRPDANDLIGPGMANAVSGSGSGGEERPPARIGFKLLDDGSGNPDLAFRVLHPPSQDGDLVLQALDMRQPLLVEPDIRLPQRDGSGRDSVAGSRRESRSEERRVGKEWVRTGRSRWWPEH